MRYVLVLCALCAGVLAVSGQEAAPTCTVGTVSRAEYYAEVIQTRMFYTVYLPPCYERSDQSYPVIYLMHGSNEDDNHWLRLGIQAALDAGIADGTLPPMIVVFPFGNWIANENRFDAASWGNVFLSQLMPLVEQNYRILAGRDSRAIGGISRGGFWAYHLALRNPVLFSAVGGHSAFFDRFHAPPEANPLDLALSAPGVEALALWLDRGADDYAAPGLTIMDERLRERGVPYTYTIYPEGRHDNTYWSAHVVDYLRFYAAHLTPDEVSVATPPTAAPLPTAAPVVDNGDYLLLPVVAFPSLQTTLTMEQVVQLHVGFYNPDLILGDTVAETLRGYGVPIAPETTIIAADRVFNALWRDRSAFTLLPFDELSPRYRVLWVDDVHPLDLERGRYPFVFPGAAPNFDPERLTTLLMSGVTALTRRTREVLDANGIEWAAADIVDYVQRADFFHISNEVSIYPTCPQTDGVLYAGIGYSFCSKAEHFELLNLLGVDLVELSGNHNNDYGYEAYRDTLAWYVDAGMVAYGGGETLEAARQPALIAHHGNRIALVACNWAGPYFALVNEEVNAAGGVRPGAAGCDLNWLRDLLPRLQADHDVVIVSTQYVEFDQYTPTAAQQSDFLRLVNLGADVVLGTQAHFPQTYDFIARDGQPEAVIHYGLGNLFFDQEFFGGRRFFMDRLFIYDGRLLTVEVFPGIIEGQGRPRLMTPAERENFLYMMFVQYGGM